MDHFRIISFTHKTISLKNLGALHIEDSKKEELLPLVKEKLGLNEWMYLSTCNRIEFFIVSKKQIDQAFLECLYTLINPSIDKTSLKKFVAKSTIYYGLDALEHSFEVASSLDSMVVGEREIITQVRNAYELSSKLQTTGDVLRLVIKKTIETAKKIYTHTDIARKPVSVVSLACRKLKEYGIKKDAKILFIGSGVTNQAMSKYLLKHGFSNFVVFNRTLANAKKFASDLNNAPFYDLKTLNKYKQGFDILISCTAASEYIINEKEYQNLIGTDKSKKIVIDLAIPNDFNPVICKKNKVELISINSLKTIAEKNLKERKSELKACKQIIQLAKEDFNKTLKEREVELAMSEVPQKIKEIKQIAINEVFAKELIKIDDQSREVLVKVMDYMEKKYISIPMKMAKTILLKEASFK